MSFDYLIAFVAALKLMKIDSAEILTFLKIPFFIVIFSKKKKKIDEIFENFKIPSEPIFINFRAINAIK